ncbi:DUF1033 family protein [Rossellomorea aquimaris]|uniref:DUF1033 family protein n=1 Tax=Rossellomorea aquimaris TaxID=189382 RepID=UPI001CD4A421|nr:DUF1033 family protein [Rossellomorea aquimaris]MCA1053947.1 DUF1033 family protein [Rossellomorea aquimaris]
MENTWKVILTRSDAEPWWFFDGWKEDIVKEWDFQDRESAITKYLSEIDRLKEQWPKSKSKTFNSIAFWNPEEIEFCEACDDDVQVYHGILLFEQNQPMAINEQTKKHVIQLLEQD